MAESRDGAVASVAQLLGAWQSLVADHGPADIEDGAICTRWADVAFSFYNCVTFSEPDVEAKELERNLLLAAGYMRRKKHVGFLWLFKELLTDDARLALDRLVDSCGLAYAMPCWGMVGEVLPLSEPHYSALRFERVSSEAHLDAYAHLNARAYGMSSDDAKAALRGSKLFRNGMHAYVAYQGDQPVSCAGTVPVGDCLFVALVATHPDRQRRGFGEAVTRKALHEGAKATGLRRATLHATAAGRPVYERIGLRSTSEMALYMLKEYA